MKHLTWIVGVLLLLVTVAWAVPINIDGKNIYVTGGNIIGDGIAEMTGILNITGTGTGTISGYTIIILPGTVTAAMLAGSGTPNNTTFFRGDGAWAVPSSSIGDNVITPSMMQVSSGFANSGTFYRGDGVWGSVIPADNSLTNAKIQDNAILTGKIATGTLLNANFADNTILSGKLVFLPVPDNNASVGTKGSWAMDNTYFYWCYADNNWRRTAYDNTW